MTDEHNTDDAEEAATLAADREHIAALPSVRVMGATTALQEIVRQDHASLRIPALLNRLATDGLLSPALRVWALVLAELGPARLPGGELVDMDGQPLTQVSHLLGPPEVLTQQWLDDFRVASTAAVERDGGRLWAHIERGMTSNAVSFAASFGVSAVNAVEQLHVSDEVLALACLLGHAGSSAERWSVAGQCFRLCHAFMMARECGPHLGFTAIAPEFESLANMTPVRRMTALAVMSASAATVMGGDPSEPLDEIDIAADPSGLPESDEQLAAVKIAVRLVRSYRESDPEGPGKVVKRMTGAESLWALWGVANLLTSRVRQLWVP